MGFSPTYQILENKVRLSLTKTEVAIPRFVYFSISFVKLITGWDSNPERTSFPVVGTRSAIV